MQAVLVKFFDKFFSKKYPYRRRIGNVAGLKKLE